MLTNPIQEAEAPSGQLPDMPIDPTWIRQGNPVARGSILNQSKDKCVVSGLWTCEPGEFDYTFAGDEFVHVFEGEATVTSSDGGQSVQLSAGKMAHFPCGLTTRWRVTTALRKFFVLRFPAPLES
jgi:uncharacterized cupin superfamily protein